MNKFFLGRQVSLLVALLLWGANVPHKGSFHLGFTLAVAPAGVECPPLKSTLPFNKAFFKESNHPFLCLATTQIKEKRAIKKQKIL
jgi:hypothetical protein